MSDTSSSSSSGIGFVGALTIAFIVLKLCHVINWPWVWVLAPLWIGLIIGLALLTLAIVLIAVFKLGKGK